MNDIHPIVKWAGGKRQLLPELIKRAPNKFENYYEPFLGGGAMFFELQPKTAYLNDVNNELINTYKVIQNNVEELIENLKQHKNDKDYFYSMRQVDRTGELEEWNDVQRASRFLFLNKTCYNGLYRVNQKGQFNTPFGRYKNPKILNEPLLIRLNQYFNNNEIFFTSQDYKDTLSKVSKGDFVYLDPPYVPLNATSYFTSYTDVGFDLKDQEDLKEICDLLTSKGAKFMHSNSNTPIINNLYKDYNIDIVQANRAINSKGKGRGAVEEVIITNY